ncbi:MAG: tRNA pseudouridine(13) synthase TruD [Gammaproteobacteria bacterium]|nr:tRNA pseudouridine(13) synthase TruD [Gammaproteobacteria bacterium]
MTANDAAPTDLPYAFGGPAGTGRLRVEPEDFIVRELPICEPDGAGEHVWLWVRKRNANTDWVARQLARFAGVTPRDVSYAGMKDRRAVTEQWFSLQLPGKADPDWTAARIEGVEILRAERHSRKLKRGALRGNAFEIRIHALSGDHAVLETRLRAIAAHGMPNYFGTQRFGHDGGNLAAAAAMLRGEGPRLDRHVRGLYLSAARSFLFNQVLAARVHDGSWERALPGDALQLDGRRAWFIAAAADTDIETRVRELDVHPTGPLWGRGVPATQGAVRALEGACLAPFDDWCAGLERAGLEQDRRALRVRVRELDWAWNGADELTLRFSLPAGSYATVLLREVIEGMDGDDANATEDLA